MNVKIRLSICTLVSYLAVASNDARGNELCDSFKNAYENTLKEMAHIDMTGLADTSAPRGTNRQLKILDQRMMQLMVLKQMDSFSCPLPKETSDYRVYSASALACKFATTKAYQTWTEPRATTPPEPAACDRSTWKKAK